MLRIRGDLAAVSAASLLLEACASVTNVQTVETFKPAEAVFIMDEGPYTISGEAFMRTVGGDVRTCAGFDVYLYPATNYATERMRVIYGSETSGWMDLSQSRKQPASTDPEYSRYSRTTKCDANGKFSFPKTAAGAYYIITLVQWSTGQPYSPVQGGSQMRRVIAGSNSENLIITP